MIKVIVGVFETRFDPDSLTLALPAAFETLKSQDAAFEMVTSNNIQKLRMEYSHNIVTKSTAHIFVNHGVNRLAHLSPEQKKIEIAKDDLYNEGRPINM